MRKIFYVATETVPENIPHRTIAGVPLVYRLVDMENGQPSPVITEDDMYEMGMDEEQLFALADANVRKSFPNVTDNGDGTLRFRTVQERAKAINSTYLSGLMAKKKVKSLFIGFADTEVVISENVMKVIALCKGHLLRFNGAFSDGYRAIGGVA